MPLIQYGWCPYKKRGDTDTQGKKAIGQVWRLILVILAFWPRQADRLSPGVQDQPGQHGKSSSLQKIQKISQVWWCMAGIPATQEAEVGEIT